MKRAALVLTLAALTLVARAEDPPHARRVKLTATIQTADGEPALLWVAVPESVPGVQVGSGMSWCTKQGTAVSVGPIEVERKEQRAPEGALASTATELSEKEKKDLARYLEPERDNQPDEEFKKLARSIAPDEKAFVKIARALYEHVLSNMKYEKPPGKGWGHGSVKWACSEKYGNCTDFHALFMNLCRQRGIPARFTMGISLPHDAKGTVDGYHCWCEFYVPSAGWVPVDVSEAWKHAEKRDYFFGNLDADRVAFVEGRDLMLPMLKSGPVSLVPIGYAERDGKAVDIKRSIAYEDVK